MSLDFLKHIAEARIQEAEEKGLLSGLPGEGRPLQLEDMSAVPPELRIAYKILKNANCLPPEAQWRKDVSTLAELLESCPDEKQQLVYARKLRLLLSGLSAERNAALEANDEYLQKILGLLARHEAKKD